MVDEKLFVARYSTTICQQVVSAHGFNSQELHVLWELFPSGWILAPHSDHSNGQNICSHGTSQVFYKINDVVHLYCVVV